MRTILTLAVSLLTLNAFSQETINGSITHDGLERTFILYVPASYSAANETPLVLNLHGYTSNADQQMLYGNFRSIADTAGFIIVHPNGTLDGTGTTHWNAGWGTGVDDVGFVSALIDSISADYSIDQSRVYSTGMSNGGFMSYYLACELSNRIAAIASVTGTMTALTTGTCGASHPTPVMEIHGTADATVPYAGNATMTPVVDVLSHWASFNNCDTSPIVTQVPNTNTTDGCTAEHQLFTNGDNGVEVEHYKIINGGHTWPGAIIAIGVTNYDFNASEVIWQFFAKYDINGRIVGINESMDQSEGVRLYPNPAMDILKVEVASPISKNAEIRVSNSVGQIVLSRLLNTTETEVTIETEGWETGIYTIQLTSGTNRVNQRFVKF